MKRIPAFATGRVVVVATPEELTARKAWWYHNNSAYTGPRDGSCFMELGLDRADMVFKREMESTRPGYWLRPVKSPREEALAQIKAAEKRQADGLVRPFSAAQYKQWSADPRPRPATYYDGSLRPDAGSYPQGSVDYVSVFREINNERLEAKREREHAAWEALMAKRRAELVRGPRQGPKVKGKRKAAIA